jgi:AcrR family transcriptional regulator
MAPIVSDDYKEKKRQDILDSAMICFAKKGYETTTVDEICKQSGVSKGTIYTYFKSKAEIYMDLMERQTIDSVAKINSALESLPTSFEKLDFLFSIYDKDYSEVTIGELVVNLEFKLHSSRHPEVNEKLSAMRQKYTVVYIKEIIEAGQKNGEINKNCSAHIYAEVFWTILHGVFMQLVHKDYPYHEVLVEMKELFYERLKVK